MLTLDNILDAQLLAESGGNANAESWKGAKGAYQFMPATWAVYGKGMNINNANDSRIAASHYMTDLYNKYGNWEQALAAYNGGDGGARYIANHPNAKQDKSKSINSYANQTVGYVNKVMAIAKKKAGLTNTESSETLPTEQTGGASESLDSSNPFETGLKSVTSGVTEAGGIVVEKFLDVGLVIAGAAIVVLIIIKKVG